jgi:hypothetical protein
MSIRQPISFEARRTFCPFLPIANDSWLSSTTISMIFSGLSTMDTRLIFAGLIALVAKVTVSSFHWMMSIFSPRNSRMID